MIDRPDKGTVLIGFLGVAVLFVPIPLLTQFIGIPLIVYASYRYWGRESNAATEPADLGREP